MHVHTGYSDEQGHQLPAQTHLPLQHQRQSPHEPPWRHLANLFFCPQHHPYPRLSLTPQLPINFLAITTNHNPLKQKLLLPPHFDPCSCWRRCVERRWRWSWWCPRCFSWQTTTSLTSGSTSPKHFRSSVPCSTRREFRTPLCPF